MRSCLRFAQAHRSRAEDAFSRRSYLKALAAAGPRFALDGTPCGEVSEEHQAAAVLRLQRLAEKAQPSRPSPPKVPPAAKAPNPPTPSASAFSIGARAVLSLKSRRRP